MKRKINILYEENFNKISEELKNNLVNGIIVKGYLKSILKMEKLIKITPNTERAKHILKIAEMTIERLKLTDTKEYVTLTTKDYYDVIKELMTAIALLDGYKTEGEGAHKILIEYIGIKYKEIATHEIKTVEDMREKETKHTTKEYYYQKTT